MSRQMFATSSFSPDPLTKEATGSAPCPSAKVDRQVYPLVVVLGACQVVIGLYCICVNFASCHYLKYTQGYGILAGLLFFASGLMEILFGLDPPNRRLAISTLVLSVLAFVTCPFLIVFSILDYLYLFVRIRSQTPSGVVIGVVVFVVIEAILALVSFVLYYRPLCCNTGHRNMQQRQIWDAEVPVLPPTESTLSPQLPAAELAEYSARIAGVPAYQLMTPAST